MQTINLNNSRRSVPLIGETPDFEVNVEKYDIPKFTEYFEGIFVILWFLKDPQNGKIENQNENKEITEEIESENIQNDSLISQNSNKNIILKSKEIPSNIEELNDSNEKNKTFGFTDSERLESVTSPIFIQNHQMDRNFNFQQTPNKNKTENYIYVKLEQEQEKSGSEGKITIIMSIAIQLNESGVKLEGK